MTEPIGKSPDKSNAISRNPEATTHGSANDAAKIAATEATKKSVDTGTVPRAVSEAAAKGSGGDPTRFALAVLRQRFPELGEKQIAAMAPQLVATIDVGVGFTDPNCAGALEREARRLG